MRLRADSLIIRSNNRLHLHTLLIENGAVLQNDGYLHTITTVSYGSLHGSGCLAAWWKTSEYITGTIDPAQQIIYYGDRPVQRGFEQIISGSIIVTQMGSQWSLRD